MHGCSLCGRPLAVAADPMSVDCGGDCWGCIGLIEAEGGYGPSAASVRDEIERGWRRPDGTAPPPVAGDREAAGPAATPPSA